jgi:hypothetical protein
LVRQRAEGTVLRGGILDRAVMKKFYPEVPMKIAEGSTLTTSGRRSKGSYVPSESEDIDLK